MQYLNSITGAKGQSATAGLSLHPGQWVKEGFAGNVIRKGCYMGTIRSSKEDIVVWDKGQPRSEFLHQMRLMRQFVIESNRPGRSMKDLMGYLARIFA